MEANSRYVALADQVFAWLEKPDHSAVTSTITMTELLVLPYRESVEQQIDEIYATLSTYPNLGWITPSLEIADTAARIAACMASGRRMLRKLPLQSTDRRRRLSQTIRRSNA